VEGVHAETSKVTKGETKVELFILEQNLLLIFIEYGKNERFDGFVVEHIGPCHWH
jgi:hypothetical protein